MDEDDRRRISQNAFSAIPELVLAPNAALPSPRFPATVLICRHDQPLPLSKPDRKVAGWATCFSGPRPGMASPDSAEFLLATGVSDQAMCGCARTRIFTLGKHDGSRIRPLALLPGEIAYFPDDHLLGAAVLAMISC